MAPHEQAESAATLPLAAAAERLRGRPGRPRTRPECPQRSHVAVTSPSQVRVVQRSEPSPPVTQTSVPPRLLGVREAGTYLGVSFWTVRNMLRDGRLCPVRVPGLVRVLVDRLDLDRLIEGWKT